MARTSNILILKLLGEIALLASLFARFLLSIL